MIKLINYDGIQATGLEISRLLASDADVVGIYSTSARNTLAISQATQDLDRRLLTVGSDVFPENIELLKTGAYPPLFTSVPSSRPSGRRRFWLTIC